MHANPNDTLELLPAQYPFIIELYMNKAVTANMANSNIGLATQECDDRMPVDSNIGIAAQCTAQASDVVVPHISIFLNALFIISITA